MATLDSLRNRREELLAIAARHGATDVRVFGSVVRGEDADASDVDFLVRMEKGRSLPDMVALQESLEKALSQQVDVVSENGIFHYLRQRILSEAQPLSARTAASILRPSMTVSVVFVFTPKMGRTRISRIPGPRMR